MKSHPHPAPARPRRLPRSTGLLWSLLLVLLPTALAGGVVAQWNFNGPDPGPPSAGHGTWRLLGDVTASVASGTGSSDPLTPGNQALSLTRFPNATNLARTAGIEFRVEAQGSPIDRLRLDLRGSAGACRHLHVESSSDGGASYQSHAMLEITRPGTFENGLEVDLGPGPSDRAPAELRVRLTAAPGPSGLAEGVSGNFGPSGTWRLDQVTFLAGATTTPPETIPAPRIAFTHCIRPQVHLGDAATNSFAEQSLRPGESLRLEVRVQDTNNRPVLLRPGNVPGGAVGTWVLDAPGGPSASAVLEVTPTEAHAGQVLQFTLEADNGQVRILAWTVYVPTLLERQVVVDEFLANPPDGIPEFLELVNLGPETVDLSGWMLGDGVAVRHRFDATTRLDPAQAVVVRGGTPILTVPTGATPVAVSSGSLSLNNGGDTLVLRNARSNLVERIVYRGPALSPSGSLARDRLPDGAFHPHPGEGPSRWSPGEATMGVPWSEGSIRTGGVVPVWCQARPSGGLDLRWEPVAGRRARVLASPSLDGSFVELLRDLTGGACSVPTPDAQAFYRVEWQ